MPNYELGEVKDLKEGDVALIDEQPCKIRSISKSKAGKHGSAKARVKGKSVIDGSKHSFTKPVDERIKIPRVVRDEAQIVADMGNRIQLMDMESYENFEIEKPEDEELRNKLEQGQTVIVKKVMDHKEITRVKNED